MTPPDRAPRSRLAGVAFLACCIATTAMPAAAETADRQAPTTVESDRMHYDDTTRVNVFTGNVVLNRGTLQIRSDQLALRQDLDGFQYGTASGRPATFRQKRDGVDEWIQGHAQELEYDGKKETVRLLREARISRTQGPRMLDEIEGGLIVYDMRTEQFNVEGSAATAPGGRVRVTILPRETDAPLKPAPPPAGGRQ
jgi:lipopolysaccharide export system protein LptA